jgi:phosphate transport system substrate-binding protein
MKTKTIIIVIIVALITSCSSQKKRDNTISISGAFALYPLVITWAEEYKKEKPGVRFNISAGGAGKGMADVLSGAVDLAMFSREITPEEINQGVWWAGVTIDAVLPTINANHPNIEQILQRGLTREEFKAIYIDGTLSSWSSILNSPDEIPLKLYTRSDACGAAGTWSLYLDGTQEDLLGVGIFGDPGLAEAVINDQLGMGFNNTIFIYDVKTGKKRTGIEVCPIDLNNNGKIDDEENNYNTFSEILAAIADGKYPSPPARELYLISKGKPQKEAVTAFIKWVLTAGQQFVEEAGYVPLNDDVINGYLAQLEK